MKVILTAKPCRIGIDVLPLSTEVLQIAREEEKESISHNRNIRYGDTYYLGKAA
jgi:hypothetical protein